MSRTRRLSLAVAAVVIATPGLSSAAGRASAAAATRQPGKLLIVMLENESRTHAFDGMPKLAAMAGKFGYATDYRAITHPSLPNYLAIAGGSTFGVGNDASPASHVIHGDSIFGQAIAAGRTAKTYAESMPADCDLIPAGRYAVKHNPWAYFADPAERAECRKFDVPSGTTRTGALHGDIAAGRLPTIGMLIPNLCDDAHDCRLAVADDWLARWLRRIQSGPDWRAGRLTVVVTFDEDDYSEANHVLTVVLSPDVRHSRVSRPLNHYSLTRYADQLIGRPALRGAAGAVSLSAGFSLGTAG